MDDRAVAPVVAAMLLLAVLVMFLSTYNAVVIPSLKQQAEVEHLQVVEESFLAFGSDMTTAAALKQDMHLSKRIPLGGGDMILDPVRSGGTLRVGGEETLASVTLNEMTYDCNLMNFSYTPNGNFWRNQGYAWQYGYTNVTGAGGIQTPLEYADMDEVSKMLAEESSFAKSLIEIEHEGTEDICTDIMITLVTFEPGEHYFTSGSGVATLSLDVSVEEEMIVSPNSIEIAFNKNLPVPLNTSLWQKCNERLNKIADDYNNIEDPVLDDVDWDQVTLTFNGDAPDVMLRQVTVVVSAR
ncbi:MAG: hypothetical protein WCY70_01830 [Methanoculleus sp.]